MNARRSPREPDRVCGAASAAANDDWINRETDYRATSCERGEQTSCDRKIYELAFFGFEDGLIDREVDDVSSGGVSTTASLGGRLGTFDSGFG
jgi:hypothetical protein